MTYPTTTRAFLFLGGPLDGETRAVECTLDGHPRPEFVVRTRVDAGIEEWPSTVECVDTHYSRHRIGILAAGWRWVFVPRGTTSRQAEHMLLARLLEQWVAAQPDGR